MPEEQAFTRRQPGVNPIALELDRLAEQKALQRLGRGPLSLAMRPPAPDRQAAYTSTLDRIRNAPGREGEADVLGQIPNDELAAHAQMANDEINRAITSGIAYIKPEDGGLYTYDPNVSFSPHLALIHEHEARESSQPTSEDPTISTQQWRGNIEDYIDAMGRMVRQ